MKNIYTRIFLITLFSLSLFKCGGTKASVYSIKDSPIVLKQIGRVSTGLFDESAAEIPAYCVKTKTLFVVNAKRGVDVIDLNNPGSPKFIKTISVKRWGTGVNSVDAKKGFVVFAVEIKDKNKTNKRGKVVFLTPGGKFIKSLLVGYLPDMVKISPDGNWVLVANEGEPNKDYSFDPEGSVSIIDISNGVKNLTQSNVYEVSFRSFNSQKQMLLSRGIRISGPKNTTVAQDLEPEYIAISDDSRTAYVSLQENNAIAVIDIRGKRIRRLLPLGYKNHNRTGNEIDINDKDKKAFIRKEPVWGLYMPDSIASYTVNGRQYIITANEGDGRDYKGYTDEKKLKKVKLSKKHFSSKFIKRAKKLKVKIIKDMGDSNKDGVYEKIYIYGSRSFSIYNSTGRQTYDSGSDFEKITAKVFPKNFNASNDKNKIDNRSDNKGPEPEGLAIGKINGRFYAFIGLERIGGFMVYDVTNPNNAKFLTYICNRNFGAKPKTGNAGDLGPEGFLFISADKSPNKKPLLIVANEVSGTTTIYQIDIVKK